MSFSSRYAKEEKDHYQYIKERNGKWVILQKGTGKVLSHHDTREKAIAAFKAMMAHKHGSVVPGEGLNAGHVKILKEMVRTNPRALDQIAKIVGAHSDEVQQFLDDYDNTRESNVRFDSSDWRNEYFNLDSDW